MGKAKQLHTWKLHCFLPQHLGRVEVSLGGSISFGTALGRGLTELDIVAFPSVSLCLSCVIGALLLPHLFPAGVAELFLSLSSACCL